MGKSGDKEKNLLPNVVYCGQRDLREETWFPRRFSDSYVIYDLTTRQETATIPIKFNVDSGPNLCFSPDGRILGFSTSSQHQGELCLIEVATGRVITHLQGRQDCFFDEQVFSQDNSTFATTTFKARPDDKWVGEGKLIVLDAATGEIKQTFDYPELVCPPPGLSSDGRALAINYWLDGDNRLELFDLTTGKRRELLKAQGLFFHEFLPDGNGFVTWDEDRVRFYHTEKGEEFAVTEVSPAMFGPASWGLNKPVSIPGSHLVSVPSANDWKPGFFLQWYERLFGVKNLSKRRFEWGLAFLDTRTGNKVATIEVPSVGGAISPDGKTLALPIDDYEQPPTIELWDIPPRKPLRWVLGLLAIPSVVTVITIRRWWKPR